MTTINDDNSELQQEMANLYPKEGFKVRSSEYVSTPSSRQKWNISLLSGILFLIISSPFLYSLVNRVAQSISPNLNLASYEGCPTLSGLVVHTLVFILVVRLLMR